MIRTSAFAVVVCLVSAAVYAQSPEQAVRKAQDAMIAAAKAGDRAAYQKFYADELQWMGSDGSIQNKQQRIASVTPNSAFNRDFQTDIKVSGNTAVESGTMVYTTDGAKHTDRVLRVFVNRNGQWQLLSHAVIANVK